MSNTDKAKQEISKEYSNTLGTWAKLALPEERWPGVEFWTGSFNDEFYYFLTRNLKADWIRLIQVDREGTITLIGQVEFSLSTVERAVESAKAQGFEFPEEDRDDSLEDFALSENASDMAKKLWYISDNLPEEERIAFGDEPAINLYLKACETMSPDAQYEEELAKRKAQLAAEKNEQRAKRAHEREEKAKAVLAEGSKAKAPRPRRRGAVAK